jgi:sulfur-carrier protein adenylyltransferase/sulfurtransferase
MNNQDLSRYSRNILLKEVGIEGQEKLLAAKVLMVGAGGLGCPALQYLTAAGVGHIGIIDFDYVDESNLQRQTLFTTADIGKNKAICAKERLHALNPYIELIAFDFSLTTNNALDLFDQYDIIIDGSDNFSTRYLINDASLIKNKPVVYGAINQFDGHVSVFNFKNGPSYRCLFPTPPEPDSIPSCSEAGVLGVLPGIIGTMQANEVIKLILGLDGLLNGKMLVYNAIESETYKLSIAKSSTKTISKSEFLEMDYDVFCGIIPKNKSELNYFEEKGYKVVDLREEWEISDQNKRHLQIPFSQLNDKLSKLKINGKYILFCENGERSESAIQFLRSEHNFTNLLNFHTQTS